MRPTEARGVLEAFEQARATGRRVVLRGAGKSYGDAAIAAEQVVVDLTHMNEIVSWDPELGVLVADAGVTLAQMIERVLPDGWWPPVVSGTSTPTLGGALAMNIHGKSSFRDGTLGEHVLWLEALTSDGRSLRAKPDDPAFRAIVGSVGTLAVVLRAAIQMKQVASGDLWVRAIPCRSLDEQFDALTTYETVADSMVGWVDAFARGRASGRGLVHVARAVDAAENSTLKMAYQRSERRLSTSFGPRIFRLTNNRFGMRTVNLTKSWLARVLHRSGEVRQSLWEYSFLLDAIPGWERAYGPGGFAQVQCFVPKGAARETFRALIALQQHAGLESFLVVLKRHRPDPFLVSPNLDGFSLAMDFKMSPERREPMRKLSREMTAQVLAAGGRFYFAKDSLLQPADVESFLGADVLAEWRRWKRELDREGLLTSELARRLRLFEVE